MDIIYITLFKLQAYFRNKLIEKDQICGYQKQGWQEEGELN